MTPASFGRACAAIAAAALVATTLTGCSSGRSVEAFCSVVKEHKDAYLSSMGAATGDENVLTSLITAAGAIGDLKTMWRDMADVAPEDIENEVELVSEGWEKREEAALSGDFLTVMASALTDSQTLARVNTYVGEKCGDEYRML